MEDATHEPRLGTIKVGGDDSTFSAVKRFCNYKRPTGNIILRDKDSIVH